MRLYDIPQLSLSQIVRGIFVLLWRYKKLSAQIVLSMILNTFIRMFIISLIIPFVQIIFPTKANNPIVGEGIFLFYLNLLKGFSIKQKTYLLVGVMGIGTWVSCILSFREKLFGTKLVISIQRDLQGKIFSRYINETYQYFLDRQLGRLVNDISTEPAIVAEAISNFLSLISQIIMSLAIGCLLILVSWQAAVIMILVSLIVWGTLRYFGNRAKRVGEEMVIHRRALNAFLTECISGIRQIKVFCAEERMVQTLAKIKDKLFYSTLSHGKIINLPPIITELSVTTMLGLGFYLYSYTTHCDIQSIATLLIPFLFLSNRLLPYALSINTLLMQLKGRGASVGVVLDLIKHLSLEKSSKGSDADNSIEFANLKNAIVFELVNFSYPNRNKTLKDINMVFEQGKITAIIGGSGAGKSTIVDLLACLFEIESGDITIDGISIRRYNLNSWREALGFVSQETFIFNGSICENIAFSDPEVEFERVVEAAKLANVHEFIESLPDGYETIVGDRGMKISGGQRQRIALARALLRNPEIIILDEATSSLDYDSERLIFDALFKIRKGHTIIIVSHRLSTIEYADKIYVLKDGSVVEEGDYATLILKDN